MQDFILRKKYFSQTNDKMSRGFWLHFFGLRVPNSPSLISFTSSLYSPREYNEAQQEEDDSDHVSKIMTCQLDVSEYHHLQQFCDQFR